MSDQETATIVVLRASDAKKVKFEMNMSDSLNDLKDNIDGSPEFGPLSRANQRIFHLGRELKTGGRSLSVLGIGRFKVFTVHMMPKQLPEGNANGGKAGKDEVVEVVGKRRGSRSRGRNPPQQQQQQQPVIELSDDDDDDDDDVVIEAVAVAPKRRRTQR